jgi:5'-AMP-activated protein kinase regulatory gamma subunit
VSDVVHMFSGRSISAVPIIDEEGVVVNLYETVDVIVCILLFAFLPLNYDRHIDSRSARRLPIP